MNCPNYILNPILPVSVAIIGAGGTGSKMLTNICCMDHALKSLGHIGFSINIFDDDEVSDANIGRQMFQEHEIGMNKAQALALRASRFFNIQVTGNARRFNKNDAHNIYISCVDSLKSRKTIVNAFEYWKHSYESNREEYTYSHILIDCGNGPDYGQVCMKLAWVKESHTFFDVFGTKLKEKKNEPSCSLAEALNKQDLFVNNFAADIASNMLWKVIRETKIDYSVCFYNLANMQINVK